MSSKTIFFRDYQQEAIEKITQNDRGFIQAPTGSGKSIIALGIIQKLDIEPALIIVPTARLCEQMKESFLTFTNIPPEKVGILKNRPLSLFPYTITTWQTLGNSLNITSKNKDLEREDQVVTYFRQGVVVCDEFHRAGASVYSESVRKINPIKMYGLTATPYRSDNLSEIYKLADNNVHQINYLPLYDRGHLCQPVINFVYTPFIYNSKQFLTEWEQQVFSFEQKLGVLKSKIGTDNKRNKYLMDQIEKNRGKNTLVLSYTKQQAQELYEKYSPQDLFSKKILATGELNKKERDEVFDMIEQDWKDLVVFATQSFMGEGIDIPKLDTLFIVTPTGGGAKVIQFVGRILRPYKEKRDVQVYDFIDNIDIANNWEASRKKMYDKLIPEYKWVKPEIISLKEQLDQLQKEWEKFWLWQEKGRPVEYEFQLELGEKKGKEIGDKLAAIRQKILDQERGL